MHDYYAKVISLQPYLETRYKNYEERKAEKARVEMIEQRNREQELLIRLLSGDKVWDSEIKVAYDAIIKEEHEKRNAKTN